MPRIVERGDGRPIVLVPGVQGRCEWGLPTVHALSGLGRVITYSLADEPTSGFAWQESKGFQNYLDQLDDVIRQTGAEHPVLVGISYGGLIAAEYAARHPGAVRGLVVASAPPPAWTLPARARRYLSAPALLTPVFWLGAPVRVYPELKAAIPDGRARLQFAIDHGLRIAGAPASTARMVRRLRWLESARFSTDHPLDLPALVVTGEPALERVVPPDATRQYLQWLPNARLVTLERTGHAGTVTRSGEFADRVGAWLLDLPDGNRPAGVRPFPESVRADRVS